MEKLLKKLHFKNQDPVLLLNVPETLGNLRGAMGKPDDKAHRKYSFILAFFLSANSASTMMKLLISSLEDDGIFWFCYPKGTSRKYASDLKRTSTAALFAPFNFEPVSQIAINEDWTAMRFRHVDFIKTMKRGWAMSEKGKERTGKST